MVWTYHLDTHFKALKKFSEWKWPSFLSSQKLAFNFNVIDMWPLYQIYPSCMHTWLWPNRESNVPQRNNVHVHPNTANMCHNMDRHTSKFVYDKRTQDVSVISKCYDFRFECTISTSDRALMDKTYIVTPTTTAGPEIFQFLSTDLSDPKFFA